ncbi:Bcd1p KNAG_0M01660 [Huiozyma naganishii CBS 8797]|uniref:Box C/D snoRNA protein 1 n=1 Tax=Huiozyma naganishii (strain ATCC MYA-139 / BCRC 22969 / CBS 8797 / KCTC 17520 / NBRC 10181 / NCYC 3082 / Yp74L-3) TaxID=1071383 RepID=J7SAT5_HUIN7|nr:hypothetical protein KNAG_0M01660 [Kazachstania naganishii CBS 8797]CCK73019.1 hypothetical protein KNAG_0M01660 [Kazachstania naganishii CBS 8797]
MKEEEKKPYIIRRRNTKLIATLNLSDAELETSLKVLQVSMQLCDVCQKEEFKYKCPRCLKKTCSLACSKRHKEEDGCSGQAQDPTEYIESGRLKQADDQKHENNHLVQRDFNFLTGFKRQLELKKTDSKQKHKRMLQSRKDNTNNMNVKKPRLGDECPRVIRRGVNCLLLPRGMQKSLLNRSKWDKAANLFFGLLNGLYAHQDPPTAVVEPGKTHESHVSHKVKETSSLIDGMSNVVFEKCCRAFDIKPDTTRNYDITNGSVDPNIGKPNDGLERSHWLSNSGLKFYTKKFPYNTTSIGDSRELIELDPTGKCIGELFRNKTVIEFPTILLAKSEEDLPIGYKVVTEELGGQELKTQPNMLSGETHIPPKSDDESVEPPEAGSTKYVNPIDYPVVQKEENESDGYDPTAL